MIRIVQPADIDSVVEIYNQAIDARFQTAFTERLHVEERAGWFAQFLDSDYPMFVYTENDTIVGWLSIGPYRSGRAALRYTVEISYFVHSEHVRKGIGSKLLTHGLEACKQLNYKTALAIILDLNTASIALMKKFGFSQWACLPGVADFDGVECSHVYYGLRMKD